MIPVEIALGGCVLIAIIMAVGGYMIGFMRGFDHCSRIHDDLRGDP